MEDKDDQIYMLAPSTYGFEKNRSCIACEIRGMELIRARTKVAQEAGRTKRQRKGKSYGKRNKEIEHDTDGNRSYIKVKGQRAEGE
jgi:hypothetical protein